MNGKWLFKYGRVKRSLLIHIENAIDESQGGELEESLISMEHGMACLSHLVGQLVSLSRSEGNLSHKQFGEVNAGELCQQTYTMLLDKTLSKQQKLSVNISDDKCLLKGNITLLSSLLRNVLDNTICYSPDKGNAELSCRHEKIK
jgi:K+-sensing histidine kinase KdpD